MKEYIVSEQILQATLQYLAHHPYAEVHQLILELQASKEVAKVQKETKQNDKSA